MGIFMGLLLFFAGYYLGELRRGQRKLTQAECDEKTLHAQALMQHYRHQAELDLMTGVYNRTYFEQHVSQRLAEQPTGYFYLIDMDNLKIYNDLYGHPYGDSMVRALGETLKEVYPQAAYIGRVGGDEFAVWDETVSSGEQAMAQGERLLQVFAGKSLSSADRSTAWTCSVGMVKVTPSMGSFDKLFCAGDKALYAAKADGKGSLCFFAEE